MLSEVEENCKINIENVFSYFYDFGANIFNRKWVKIENFAHTFILSTNQVFLDTNHLLVKY